MWRRHHLGNHLVEIKIKSVSIHCMGRRGKAESRWSMDCNDANVLMMRVARTWPGTAFHLSSDLKMSTGRLSNNLNNNDHQQMAQTMNMPFLLLSHSLSEAQLQQRLLNKNLPPSTWGGSLVASPAQMYFDALLMFGEICYEIGSGSECQFPGDCSASIITDSPSLMDHSSPY